MTKCTVDTFLIAAAIIGFGAIASALAGPKSNGTRLHRSRTRLARLTIVFAGYFGLLLAWVWLVPTPRRTYSGVLPSDISGQWGFSFGHAGLLALWIGCLASFTLEACRAFMKRGRTAEPTDGQLSSESAPGASPDEVSS